MGPEKKDQQTRDGTNGRILDQSAEACKRYRVVARSGLPLLGWLMPPCTRRRTDRGGLLQPMGLAGPGWNRAVT